MFQLLFIGYVFCCTKFDKPVLGLTLDEHTGEAGFITRIEAFIDMLYRKKRSSMVNKNNSSEYNFTPQTNICETVLFEK